MSLPILVAIVSVGITLVIAAVHFTGGSRRSVIVGIDQARQLLIIDFPKETPGEAMVTADRQSAFMTLDGDRIGIVQSFGAGFFTRIVSAKDVAAIKLRPPATVSLRFRDFTWTGGHFTFADTATAHAIATALGMKTTTES